MKRCLSASAFLLSIVFSAMTMTAPRPLQWSELIPPGAPAAPEPIPLHQEDDESGPPARQLITDAPVDTTLNGEEIKLPGYIVPLDIDASGKTTAFFLVPYYGACIHVPPPPSNQIIYVESDKGVAIDELYQPYWIEGPLAVQPFDGGMARTGYRLRAKRIYPYP